VNESVTIEVPARYTKSEYYHALTVALGGLVAGHAKCESQDDRAEFGHCMTIIGALCHAVKQIDAYERSKIEGGAA